MMARKLFLVLAIATATAPVVAAQWDTPESRARWATLGQAIYGSDASRLETAGDRVAIDTPEAAANAALVPVAIKIAPDVQAKELDLVVDQNPSPIAAKIVFGPAGDPRVTSLRVRVDAFTNMHAVARAADGRLLQAATFVQGAGGCSAPMGMSVAEASAGLGEMRMRFATDAGLGDAPRATLMIRHPNFNGMQTDPATHRLMPARYIRSIAVARGGEAVFTMTTDISLATNPVIEFLYKRGEGKPFEVTVVDSTNATWTQKFDAPPKGQQAQR